MAGAVVEPAGDGAGNGMTNCLVGVNRPSGA
jgi:hypothetical protein